MAWPDPSWRALANTQLSAQSQRPVCEEWQHFEVVHNLEGLNVKNGKYSGLVHNLECLSVKNGNLYRNFPAFGLVAHQNVLSCEPLQSSLLMKALLGRLECETQRCVKNLARQTGQGQHRIVPAANGRYCEADASLRQILNPKS